MISIIAIGKKHEDWVQPAIARYEKRLRPPWNIEWALLPHSSLEGLAARNEESERILSKLSSTDTVVLLDETGKLYDSPTLSQTLDQLFSQSRSVVVIIGGAYGVNDALQQRADHTWSLSPLVFPHQLVRAMLVEQFYRAQEVARGGKYHHE